MEQGKEGLRDEAPCGLGCRDARGRCSSHHHHTRPVLCCTALFLFAARTGSHLHSALGVPRTGRCLIKPRPAAAKSLQGEALYCTLSSIHSSYFPPHLVSLIRTTRHRRPLHRPHALLVLARARRRLLRPAMYSYVHTRGKEASFCCTTRTRVGKVGDLTLFLPPPSDLPPLASVQSRVELADASSAHHHALRCAPRMDEHGAGVLRTEMGMGSGEGERGHGFFAPPRHARALDGRTRGLKRRGGSAVSRVAAERVGGRDGFYGAGCVGRTRRDAPGMYSNWRSRGVVPSPFPPAVPSSIAESRCFVSPACPAKQSPRGLFSTLHCGSWCDAHVTRGLDAREGREEGGRTGQRKGVGAGIRVPPRTSRQDPLERASLPAPAWGHTRRARRHLGPSCSRVCRSARTSFAGLGYLPLRIFFACISLLRRAALARVVLYWTTCRPQPQQTCAPRPPQCVSRPTSSTSAATPPRTMTLYRRRTWDVPGEERHGARLRSFLRVPHALDLVSRRRGTRGAGCGVRDMGCGCEDAWTAHAGGARPLRRSLSLCRSGAHGCGARCGTGRGRKECGQRRGRRCISRGTRTRSIRERARC
ncbi:hypothetical protein DFH08DRAFT_322855 [Mycena albidolilacea]|uniref:Uncharacterized protein n=1 Tax=Mycena albidolilacea TaxID=1033008 RepID=A0AAD7ALF5_9AGAR|nr:hypothetical protein DFH08DRAFT_322855 [Mycena albidolilacea]